MNYYSSLTRREVESTSEGLVHFLHLFRLRTADGAVGPEPAVEETEDSLSVSFGAYRAEFRKGRTSEGGVIVKDGEAMPLPDGIQGRSIGPAGFRWD